MTMPQTRWKAILADVRHYCDRPAVLVGGGVRDLLLRKSPEDFDVYVLRSEVLEIAPAFQRARTIEAPREVPFPRFPNLAAEYTIEAGRIQVVATPLGSVQEILAEVDWNVSAFAFDGTRVHAAERIENVVPGRPLVLRKVTNPIPTLKRGFDFERRLGMLFRSRDVVRLCEMVASGDFRKIPRRRRRRRPTVWIRP